MGLFFFIFFLVGLRVSRHFLVPAIRICTSVLSLLYFPFSSRIRNSSAMSSSLSTNGGVVSSPSASRSLSQYLNQILSMRGPNQLPYDEDVKWAIRQNLLDIVKDFAGLQVKSGSFTHVDGRNAHLLQVFGTIPMYFREVKYNIPVTMWLLEAFPRVGPLILVTPTQDMVIRPQHPLVDASGIVSVPYLQQWIYPRSNLSELARKLSDVFGRDPPLYSRAAAVPAHQRVQQSNMHSPSTSAIHGKNPLFSPSNHSTGSPRLHSPAWVSGSGNRYDTLNPPYTVSPAASSRLPVSAVKGEDPGEVFRQGAISCLSELVQRDMSMVVKQGSVEMDELFSTQVLLNERSERVSQGLEELKREKVALEEELQLYMTNTSEMESWLRQNDGGISEFNVDRVFEPSDALSSQLLESTAADLAIEDILYSLDRAVQDGVVTWDSYYRVVRSLSREQFYLRATCAKVLSTQRHRRVESMALRVPVQAS